MYVVPVWLSELLAQADVVGSESVLLVYPPSVSGC